MPRGGARPNTGPKPGSHNKKTRAIAEKAAASGITPLEVMIDNMRFYHNEAAAAFAKLTLITEGKPDAHAQAVIEGFRSILDLRTKAGDAAKDAAPFMHARISPVDAKSKEPDAVPLAERIKSYVRDDAIEASAGKVVPLTRKGA